MIEIAIADRQAMIEIAIGDLFSISDRDRDRDLKFGKDRDRDRDHNFRDRTNTLDLIRAHVLFKTLSRAERSEARPHLCAEQFVQKKLGKITKSDKNM